MINRKEKLCPKCKLTKNITEYGNHKLHDKICINTYCVECTILIGKENWSRKKNIKNIKNRSDLTVFDVKEIEGSYLAKCINCKEYKEFFLFGKNKKNKWGIAKYCKQCKKDKDKKNYLKHRTKNLTKRKENYQNNKQKYQEFYKNKRKTDKSFVLNEKNKNKLYREKNKETLKEKKKLYYLKNKTILNKKSIVKKNSNINLRLKQNLRSRIWHALKNGNKKENFEKLIGCTVDFLKEHLQYQFKLGMNWDNYGSQWHVDHIKPCVSYDMTQESQRLECFNYKNLQPLWKLENLIKNRF